MAFYEGFYPVMLVKPMIYIYMYKQGTTSKLGDDAYYTIQKIGDGFEMVCGIGFTTLMVFSLKPSIY